MQESTINSIQAGILRQLNERGIQRFAELNSGQISSDQFSYHLRQLVKYGFVEKSEDKQYSLSPKGKTRNLMLYPNKDGFIEQGFLAVRVLLTKVENGQEYFLMQKRTLSPYTGTYATPGDKIIFGENVNDAAVRAMEKQTGLKCSVELKGLTHLKDLYQGEIMQDKYFFVFAASNPVGTLLPTVRTGENIWLTCRQIKDSGLSIQFGLEILGIAKSPRFTFKEVTLEVDSY